MRNLSIATIFAAISGFAIIFAAPHILGEALSVEFMAVWGLFFAFTGLIDGLTQETTRGVSSAVDTGKVGSARPLVFALVIGAAVTVVLAATAPLWIGRLVSSHHALASILLVLGLVSYAMQAALAGLLSGLKLWNQFALLLALDSGIRMLIVGIAAIFGWGLPAFLVVTIIGALSWAIVLAVSPAARTALTAATDISGAEFRRNALQAMLATGATAVLITGFPTMLKFVYTNPPSTGVTLGGLVIGITLTRAPILVPLQRFQSALIVFFVERRGKVLSALARPIGAVFAVGLIGAVAAWAIGPWIMATFFPEGFEVPGLILAALTFASACTGALMITSTAAMAMELHRLYIVGWVVASIVAFGLLLTPLPLAAAACAALLAGPITGVIVQVAGLVAADKVAT